MLSINTNLSNLITQRSMKSATKLLNQAVERMTTGYKVNHAKDNAASYSIISNMNTKINSLMVAEDNVAQGIDLITTAESNLEILENRVQRLRDLQEQASNGTYGEQSLRAINSECNSLVDEINRLYETCRYNGINLFLSPTTLPDGRVVVAKESDAELDTTFKELGITSKHFEIYDTDDNLVQAYDLEEDDAIEDFFTTLQTHGFRTNLKNGEITLSSPTGLYIAGDLADELGITTREQSYIASTDQSYSVNVETTSAQVSSTTVLSTTTTQATQTNTVWTTTTTSTTLTNTIYTTTTTEQTVTDTIWTTTTTSATQTNTVLIDGATVQTASTGFIEYFSVRDTSTMTALSSVDINTQLSGTYSISTTAELQKLATMTNNGNVASTAEFVLANNIDMTGITEWTAIGNDTNGFLATFDGNGYAVQNLNATIVRQTSVNVTFRECIGFFGSARNSTIKNFGLENVDLAIKVYNNSYCGALIGYAYGATIENCYVKGDVSYELDPSWNLFEDTMSCCLAGLAGRSLSSTIKSCYLEGDLDTSSIAEEFNSHFMEFSGITSSADVVDKCFYSGTITVNGLDVGGLVQAVFDGNTLSNSYANVNIIGCNTYSSGGVCNLDYSGSVITNCYSSYTNELRGVNASSDWDGSDRFTYSLQSPYVADRTVVETTTVQTTTTTSNTMTQTLIVTTTTPTTETQTIYTTTTSSTTQTTTLYVTTTSSTTQTSTVWITSTVVATGGTTFEELGVSSAFKVTVVSDGTKSSLTIDKNTTFDEFFAQLTSKGFGVSESFDEVTFTAQGDTYLASNYLKSLLSMGTLNKTEDYKTINTESEHLTYDEILENIYAPGKVNLQIGTGSDPHSQIEVDVSFKLTEVNSFRNIGLDSTTDYLTKLDDVLSQIRDKQVYLGAASNRLESALDEISTQYENLVSSRSTLRDADVAEETSVYIQHQILQQASATLMATANQAPAIALQLI